MDEDLKLIDISKLDEDPQLLAELRALGWSDNHPTTSHDKGRAAVAVSGAEQELELELEEVEVELDESDFSDPELLGLLQSMSPDGIIDIGGLTPETSSLSNPSQKPVRPPACPSSAAEISFTKPPPAAAASAAAGPKHSPGPISPKPPKLMPSVTPPPVAPAIGRSEEAYCSLLRALNEARDCSLQSAKALKEKALLKEAAEKMRLYKKYSQEIDVLNSRRAVGSPCALFHWQSEKHTRRVENLDIGECSVRVEISHLTSFDSSAVPVGSVVTLDYCLNIPKDSPITGSAMGTCVSAERVDFNHSQIHKLDTRSKSLQSLVGRRKATFTLFLKKWGFFGGSLLPLGQALMPLSDLADKCAVSCDGLPLLEHASATKGSRAKGLPGALRASVKLRTPLSGPQEERVSERVLMIGEWLDAEPSPAKEAPSSSSSSAEIGDKFSSLTDLERRDPFSVDLLESNDVMTAELEILAQPPAPFSTDDEEARSRASLLSLRKTLLETKQAVLQMKVQQQTLSLEDYILMVEARIERDKLLALYLSGTVADKAAAVKVLRRVKIMQAEIVSVEET